MINIICDKCKDIIKPDDWYWSMSARRTEAMMNLPFEIHMHCACFGEMFPHLFKEASK